MLPVSLTVFSLSWGALASSVLDEVFFVLLQRVTEERGDVRTSLILWPMVWGMC